MVCIYIQISFYIQINYSNYDRLWVVLALSAGRIFLYTIMFQKSDERILGDSDFVAQVLSVCQEQMERKHILEAKGYNLDKATETVSNLMNLERSEICAAGKECRRVAARNLLCFWAVRELGFSMAELSRQLKLSISGISLSDSVGKK